MSENEKQFKKIVYLSFPPTKSSKPLVCNLARLYDLTFNILKANITPRQEGFMSLELTGSEENYKKGVNYLKEQGIRVQPVAQKISRNEDSCMQCGLCTALCTTGAMSLDPESRLVVFDADKCSACGLCVRICPVHAVEVDVENGVLS